MQLPVLYQEKMKALLGDEYEAYTESLDVSSYRGIRVNNMKLSTEEFKAISPFPCTEISWIPNGFYISEDAPASKHPFYAAGLYYLQEPSAMTPARTIPIDPGDKVLDLCAAPGGKATELAAKLKHTGLLVANDISNSRAKGLLKNLELFGMPNILVTSETPEKLTEYFPEYFDKILIDAPCSGEGMFRKDPSMIKSWVEHGPEYYAPIQREILFQAARMLKPGGMILYSTCTFDPLENEGVIQALLEADADFSVAEVDSKLQILYREAGFCPGRPDLIFKGREELKNCFRLYPHKVKGEGHFLALLKKAGTKEENLFSFGKSGKGTDEEKYLQEFLKQIQSVSVDEKAASAYELRIQKEQVYALPKLLPSLRKLRFLRTGCYLGELAKKRFEPSQALAMVLKKEQWPLILDLEPEDPRVIRYLKGETLEADEPETSGGWVLVCVAGHPLGWGKLVNGTLRNKYYPGWRW